MKNLKLHARFCKEALALPEDPRCVSYTEIGEVSQELIDKLVHANKIIKFLNKQKEVVMKHHLKEWKEGNGK